MTEDDLLATKSKGASRHGGAFAFLPIYYDLCGNIHQHMQYFYTYLQGFDLTPFEQYALHTWAGLLIAFTSKKHGLVFAVLAGLGKELLDQYAYGGFDVVDMLCTIGGGYLQRRLIKISFTKKD